MKKKSIKVKTEAAPAPEVIQSEPAMEVDSESKISLKKKIKSEYGVAPASKAIKKQNKVVATMMEEVDVSSSEVTTNLASKVIKKKKKIAAPTKEEVVSSSEDTTNFAPETDIKSESVETKPEDVDTDEGEENPDKKSDKDSFRKGLTIFVGNLPTTTSKSQLKTLFHKYGTIQSMRFRTNDGQKIYFKQDLADVLSLNAYVRFSFKEEMEKACEMNGKMVGENRIRVCPEGTKQIGSASSTVFVGNIKQGTTENELHDFFSQVGRIEFIRYLAHKYIAYICFKKGVSMRKVLTLDQEKLNNRPLRVQLVDLKRTNVKVNKKGHTVKRRPFLQKSMQQRGAGAKADAKNGGKANDDFHGEVAEAKKKNKNKSRSSGFGSVKHKKMLSKKLQAAMDKE